MTRLASVLLLLALSACGPSRPPWADGAAIVSERPAGAVQDIADAETRLLSLHNRERAAVAVPPLVWDEALEQAAAAYAAELARTGRFAHSPRDTRPGQGENLWMGTRGAFGFEEMVGSWAAEKSLFRPGIFPDVSSSGRWEDVAHYTAMIWRGTTRLGCALGRSDRTDYLVCRYAPSGNVPGQRAP